MGKMEREIALCRAGIADMSAEERRAFMAALNGGHVMAIALARGRAMRKRDSDKVTDARRRVLVGARVPRDLAARVKQCADARGVSVYRFLVDTIEQVCENEGGQTE